MTVRTEPATSAHFARYAIALTAVAVLGWFLARLLRTSD
jgi:hypothetical protein